jgi:hypothetical protein
VGRITFTESVSSATDAPVCAQRAGRPPCETEIDALLTEDLVLASKHFVTNQLTFEAQVRFDAFE